jgi:hypothetical protein
MTILITDFTYFNSCHIRGDDHQIIYKVHLQLFLNNIIKYIFYLKNTTFADSKDLSTHLLRYQYFVDQINKGYVDYQDIFSIFFL